MPTCTVLETIGPKTNQEAHNLPTYCVIFYCCCDIQGKYISWFLLQGSSVSSTKKNENTYFFSFQLQYSNDVHENYQKSIYSPSNIRIMECSIAFSREIIRKDKFFFVVFFFLEAILLPMVLLRNKEFSFQLILKEISKIYIACLWITANFIVVHKLYI